MEEELLTQKIYLIKKLMKIKAIINQKKKQKI